MVFDLQRFSTISNSNSSSVVAGTGSSDSIYNRGAYSTIYANDGNASTEQ